MGLNHVRRPLSQFAFEKHQDMTMSMRASLGTILVQQGRWYPVVDLRGRVCLDNGDALGHPLLAQKRDQVGREHLGSSSLCTGEYVQNAHVPYHLIGP